MAQGTFIALIACDITQFGIEADIITSNSLACDITQFGIETDIITSNWLVC